jgi:hypothetical protein
MRTRRISSSRPRRVPVSSKSSGLGLRYCSSGHENPALKALSDPVRTVG